PRRVAPFFFGPLAGQVALDVLELERGGPRVGARLGAPGDAVLAAQADGEGERPDGDLVAAAQGGLAADTVAVEEGAVAAAEVNDGRLAAADADDAVVAADGGRAEAQVAVRPAADQELLLGDGDLALFAGIGRVLNELGEHGRPSCAGWRR